MRLIKIGKNYYRKENNMHPVNVTKEDLGFLKEARDKKDWHILVSWKQRYLYQRCIALPSHDLKAVIEIGREARKLNYCQIT